MYKVRDSTAPKGGKGVRFINVKRINVKHCAEGRDGGERTCNTALRVPLSTNNRISCCEGQWGRATTG